MKIAWNRRTLTRILEEPVLLLLVCAFICLGFECPNMGPKHVDFETRQGWVQTFKVAPIQGVEVKITSFSDYLNCTDYLVALTISVKATSCEKLNLDPSKVKVLVDGTPLRYARDYPVPRLDTLSAEEYVVGAGYQLQGDFNSHNDWQTLRMTIVLDSLLLCDGQAVPIDSIQARDSQHCM